ncbi:ABC transporter permease [Pseudoalteromonas phenolica]|uniref:ABC transporter permease n=1 Tax=Pseudoalteromonas phenolica TaxID=161398 RepID=UPI001F4F78D8|nr:ABC transporter permease [Pseudoalteromonas phenolica]
MMFSYYVKLALISLKRTPLLSFLMVMLIAMGIGATMTTYTVNYMMSQDPIPSKSDNLYSVQIDSRGDGVDYSYLDTIPPEMTYQDAMSILKSDIPKYQAVISAIRTTVKNPAKHDTAVTREVRTTSADFFSYA